MSAKQCLKCQHSTTYDGQPPLACPACGAIYSKVEEALRTGAVKPKAQPAEPEIKYLKVKGTPAQTEPQAPDVHAFVRQMRADSLYPAWRKIVGLVTIVWYLLAVVALIIGIVSTNGSFLGVLAGAGTAAFIAIFARIGKELSLMLADLSDAAAYQAAARSQDQAHTRP